MTKIYMEKKGSLKIQIKQVLFILTDNEENAYCNMDAR